jgi:hypothetical protein
MNLKPSVEEVIIISKPFGMFSFEWIRHGTLARL